MEWLNQYVGDVQLTSWVFQRMLATIYLVAFLVALQQFPALLGERGLLPVSEFTRSVAFKYHPSIFHWRYSDRLLRAVAGLGIFASAVLIFAINDHLPWWCTTALWLSCYALYLSIVNVGQQFYSFGWESMLLEAGFFAAFMCPMNVVAPAVPILILRWMLFRVEFGAGMIKIRHDSCWRDLTCLYYHHETQPMPNPLSWYFHRLPKLAHKAGVAFSHLVQIVIPFGLFAPQPVAAICGAFIILHQLILIVSGNYSWLNWLTVALGVTAFSDSVFGLHFNPSAVPLDSWHQSMMIILLAATAVLSVQPAINLFSKEQLMNFSYNPLHLVNAYGAFGSVSRERYEVVLEGTEDSVLTAHTKWLEYEFRGKPGPLDRTPPQVAPYHMRLDWLMWFLPFSVFVSGKQIRSYGYELWFLRFVQRLLQADPSTINLIRRSPFEYRRPTFIRARYYLYEYTNAKEKKETGNIWKRTLIGEYMPPVRLSDLEPVLRQDTFTAI